MTTPVVSNRGVRDERHTDARIIPRTAFTLTPNPFLFDTQMFRLSPTAITEVKRLRAKHNPNTLFRLQVQSGGCSGLFYDLKFEQEVGPGDYLYDCSGIPVVVDAQSLNYISELTLDYSEDLMGGGFRFHNPNATALCGCGNSFSTSDAHS